MCCLNVNADKYLSNVKFPLLFLRTIPQTLCLDVDPAIMSPRVIDQATSARTFRNYVDQMIVTANKVTTGINIGLIVDEE